MSALLSLRLNFIDNDNHTHEISAVCKAVEKAHYASAYFGYLWHIYGVFDVNDFKQINDTQGHQRGDEILRIVGSAIKDAARVEDSCIRYGGDEFCIILVNCREEPVEAVFLSYRLS
jgi:diguanylate cyclase (GGDEF)-like protein